MKLTLAKVWFTVYTLLIVTFVLLFTSCSEDLDHSGQYLNMNCVIVEKIPVVAYGKTSTKGFLIRDIQDTTLYTEFTNLNNGILEDSIYYNHEVGDTLHFDYILQSRFFRKY